MDHYGLISIIIPVYNVRPFLAEALESVINQTYTNLEIIVVDDGSTDGSGEICDDYAVKDERITVIHQNNRGLSAARNKGLDIMGGKAVAFLDSDDAYHPEYVSEMMAAMIREKADLVICKCTVHQASGKMALNIHEKSIPSIGQGIYNRIDGLCFLAEGAINHTVWNKLYRRTLWEDMRFPEDHVYEDIDTTYRIINLCKKICVLDQPLYFHRTRPGSITETCSKENIDDCNLAFLHFESFVSRNIPEIFTNEHLKKVQRSQMDLLINQYLRNMRNRGNGEKSLANDLRDQIIQIGRDVNIEDYRICRRILYWMICRVPWLLRLVYPIYIYTRQTEKRFIERVFDYLSDKNG